MDDPNHHSIPSPSSPPPAPSSSPSTTVVFTDAYSFRHLVQRLTGEVNPARERLPAAQPRSCSSKSPAPAQADSSVPGPRRPAFKLQDRRHNMRKLERLEIKNNIAAFRNFTRQTVSQSPVTPLGSDVVFTRRAAAVEEDKAMAERGYYLHPSPVSSSQPPELLALFPLESPNQQKHMNAPRDL